MSRSVNVVHLLGNLGQNPEVRYTGNGTAVCSVSLATNETWVKDGAKVEQTQWHRLVIWKKLAEIAGEYAHKGDKVFVSGRLQYRTFTDKENIERTAAEVVVDRLVLLSPKRNGELPVEHEEAAAESEAA